MGRHERVPLTVTGETMHSGTSHRSRTGPASHRIRTGSRVLTEGKGADMVKDAVQYAVGAAAEYGVGAAGGALTLPAGAEGVAAGPAVETVIDSIYAADSVKSAVEGVVGLNQTAGQYADLIKKAYNSYSPNNWKVFYGNLRKLVQQVLKSFSGARRSIDKAVKELKELLEGMINALTRPIEKAIQFVIPDATLGMAASKGIGTALKSMSENAYDLATGAIDKVSVLKNFVSDPDIALGFFGDLIDTLVDLLRKVADKIDNSSSLAAWTTGALLGIAGGPGAWLAMALTKGVGPKALRAAADELEKRKPLMLDLVSKILKIVVPYMMISLALFQIMMRGEYNIGGTPAEASVAEARLRSKVRSLVREELGQPRSARVSRSTEPPIVAERWQRLAGIIKG